MKLPFLFLLFSLTLVGLVSAQLPQVIIGSSPTSSNAGGIPNVNIQTPTPSTNYSTVNVNNSLYWQGHTGTDGSWLTGISGGSGGNPFDQVLNTTSNSTFYNANITNIGTIKTLSTQTLTVENGTTITSTFHPVTITSDAKIKWGDSIYFQENSNIFDTGLKLYVSYFSYVGKWFTVDGGSNKISISPTMITSYQKKIDFNDSSLWTTSNINATNVTASYFKGDGSLLTNIAVSPYYYNKTQIDNNLSLRYLATNPNNYVNATSISNSTIARTGDCPAGYAVMNATTNGVQCVSLSGASQTPWVADIDGGGFSLTNANNVNATYFSDGTCSLTGGVLSGCDGSGLTNLPQQFDQSLNTTNDVTFNSLTLTNPYVNNPFDQSLNVADVANFSGINIKNLKLEVIDSGDPDMANIQLGNYDVNRERQELFIRSENSEGVANTYLQAYGSGYNGEAHVYIDAIQPNSQYQQIAFRFGTAIGSYTDFLTLSGTTADFQSNLIETNTGFSVGDVLGVSDNFDPDVDSSVDFIGGIATTINTIYDSRLMSNITYLNSGNASLTLTPIKFLWSKDGLKQFKNQSNFLGWHTGYTGQDVNKFYPDCTIYETKNLTGKLIQYYHYNSKCVSLYQTNEIKALKDENALLQNQLNAVSIKVDKLCQATTGDVCK